VGCTHGEKFRKKFSSEQRIIGSPKFGGSRHETLVVNSQLLGDFGARHNFPEGHVPFRVRDLGVEISFDLGRGEMSEDKSDNLAFDEVEVNGCRKAHMALLGQVQQLNGDIRDGHTVGYALRDIPEVKGEVLGDEKGFVVRRGLVKRTGNGTVWKDVGVVFIASIVECGCDLDSEEEGTSDYLNGRDRDRERGSAGCGEIETN